MIRQHLKLRPWKRHSLVLSVLGLVYVLLGVSYFVSPTPRDREESLQVPLSIMPMWAWAMLFIVVGLLAIISSRWPPASETWGYIAMSSLSALWASFYVWGVFYGAPAGTISGALVWGGLAFLWWAISGLVNPPAPDRKVGE